MPDNSPACPRKGPSNCSLYDQVIKNAMRFVDVTNGAIAESPNRSNRFFTAAFFVSISTHNSTRNRHHAGLLRGRGLPRRGTLCGATLASRLVALLLQDVAGRGLARFTPGGARHT